MARLLLFLFGLHLLGNTFTSRRVATLHVCLEHREGLAATGRITFTVDLEHSLALTSLDEVFGSAPRCQHLLDVFLVFGLIVFLGILAVLNSQVCEMLDANLHSVE